MARLVGHIPVRGKVSQFNSQVVGSCKRQLVNVFLSLKFNLKKSLFLKRNVASKNFQYFAIIININYLLWHQCSVSSLLFVFFLIASRTLQTLVYRVHSRVLFCKFREYANFIQSWTHACIFPSGMLDFLAAHITGFFSQLSSLSLLFNSKVVSIHYPLS